MKKVNLIISLLLMLFGSIGNVLGADLQKTETFENQEAGTTYNGQITYEATTSNAEISWYVEHGTVSTSSFLTDAKSMHMRAYYTASSASGTWNGALPYLETKTAIKGLKSVAFNAAVSNTGLKMDVYYSTNGTSWTQLGSTYTFSNTSKTAIGAYNIQSSNAETDYYIKIAINSSSTHANKPSKTGNYTFRVDDILFTYANPEDAGGSTYTVVYANGGHGTAPSQQTEQTEITLTSLNADDGWNHTGWKADKDVKVDGVTKTAGMLLGKTDKCTLTANTTFTAQWECANTITISKGAETNGKFTLGTSGSVCIDGGNASTTVTCSPNTHYHVSNVTSTGGDVNGSGNSWTVSNISANTTINVTFEEDTKYTVIFKNAGTQVSSKQVYANEAIGTLPEKGTMESCDDTSTTFMGWTTATISEKTSTEPTYVTAETVVDHDNFVVNAVWAKEK